MFQVNHATERFYRWATSINWKRNEMQNLFQEISSGGEPHQTRGYGTRHQTLQLQVVQQGVPPRSQPVGPWKSNYIILQFVNWNISITAFFQVHNLGKMTSQLSNLKIPRVPKKAPPAAAGPAPRSDSDEDAPALMMPIVRSMKETALTGTCFVIGLGKTTVHFLATEKLWNVQFYNLSEINS